MRRAFVLGLFVWVMSGAALAQQPPLPVRDYAVLNPSIILSDDRETFTVRFTVRNAGGNPGVETRIVVRNLLTQTILSESVLPPIAGGDSVNISIPFTTREFTQGQLPIQIEVGLDEFEPQDSPLAGNNIAQISVTIPAMPAQAGAPAAPASPSLIERVEGGVRVLGREIADEQLAVGGVALLGVVLMLWIISIIVRAIFSHTPEFSAWQPAYAYMPMLDPHSTEGRRQAWQMHAQNGLILTAPTPGSLHVIKQLLGTDGTPLSNWKATGLRLSQYDNYGRVARTQYIASSRLTGQLTRLMQRRTRMKPEQLEKEAGRLARRLVGQFRRNITARTAFLPVALDLRLEGRHGEVRIVFELYQAQDGVWVRLDQWEPAMSVTSPRIHESYTFTIHGMHSGEKLSDYLRRLGDDVAWLLYQTLQLPAQPAGATPPQAYTVPDTLTGMEPLSA